MKLEIIKADITQLDVDVIVNAANWGLLGGGGVDGAIHRAAGPELAKECSKIREKRYPKGLPTGKAVITKGYNLKAKYIIHTVGPIYGKGKLPSKLLEDSYINSLNIAEEQGFRSIAFPAISTGIFSYPKKEAIKVVKKVMSEYKFKSIEKVVLCFYSEEDKKIADECFG
tara:strand:- start:814 stop:1323 length:510 start_codon:yes stop_codon:yes gene_type:complete